MFGKRLFALMDYFTGLILGHPLKVSIILSVDNLFLVNQFISASAMVGDGFRFDVAGALHQDALLSS